MLATQSLPKLLIPKEMIPTAAGPRRAVTVIALSETKAAPVESRAAKLRPGPRPNSRRDFPPKNTIVRGSLERAMSSSRAPSPSFPRLQFARKLKGDFRSSSTSSPVDSFLSPRVLRSRAAGTKFRADRPWSARESVARSATLALGTARRLDSSTFSPVMLSSASMDAEMRWGRSSGPSKDMARAAAASVNATSDITMGSFRPTASPLLKVRRA